VDLHQKRLNDLQRQASAEVIEAVMADDEELIAYKRRYVEEGEAQLMEAAGAPESDAMLVLETPEASLDSLFVREAGALFRRFAAKGDALGNVFIASTNLNNEGMIPALFGATTLTSPHGVIQAEF
jgi:hypothetical protein